MSYQVLARKWRPQTFSDVVGQEHVLTALANGLSLGRFHHAYLLSGTRGVGKTTIARILAKGLNCETGITATPCGQCDNCREIEQGRFVDLIEIDAASRTKVEDTRELLDNVQYAPARGRFKVYLIDEVHMLSRHSCNALLKTLEEPPAHVKFLLATTDPQKLPVTILSRCLQFHLKALNVKQICGQLSKVLQQEHVAAVPRALQLLARAADGSMRDALSLTDQAIAMGQGEVSAEGVSLMLGTLNTEQPLALIEALADADGGTMMVLLAQCAARGMDWETLLLEMLSLLHRLAMGQLLPDQLNDEENPHIMPRLRELARRLPPADLQLYYQTLLIGRKELPFAPVPRMGVEMTLLRALAFHPAASAAAAIPASAEKKTTEFSADAVTSSPVSTPIDCLTSRANIVNTTLLIKCRSARAAPGVAPIPASDMGSGLQGGGCHVARASVTEQARPVFGPGVYGGGRAGHSTSANISTQNVDDDHVSGQAAMGQKPAVGVSLGAPSLTCRQTSSPSGGSALFTRQSIAVDSADEILRQTYAASGFDDYVAQEQGDFQPGAVMLGNTAPPPGGGNLLPDTTAQLLQARTALLRRQYYPKTKKAEPAPSLQQAAFSELERHATLGKRTQQRPPAGGRENLVKVPRPDAYRWPATQQPAAEPSTLSTLKALRTALDHKKTPELALSLAAESLECDPWAAQVNRLAVPKLVQQFALHTWKEDLAPGKICLHLRASQRNLNSVRAQSTLRDALSADLGTPVELTIMEDDNLAMKTPLEWRQAIYEKKLIRAREAIMTDSHIQMLRRFFDAEVDEDSIQPL